MRIPINPRVVAQGGDPPTSRGPNEHSTGRAVNWRGEVERAAAIARMPAGAHALLNQLARRADNATGRIPDGRYAPLMATVARQSRMADRTARRHLAWLMDHGWFTRSATADRRKVAGMIQAGTGDGPADGGRVCELPGCGASMAGKRSHARYCSEAHKKAGQRAEKAGQKTGQPVASNRDMSRFESRTTAASNRDKEQVTSLESATADIESKGSADENITHPSPALPGDDAPDYVVESHTCANTWGGWGTHEGARADCALAHLEPSADWTEEKDAAWLAGGYASPIPGGRTVLPELRGDD